MKIPLLAALFLFSTQSAANAQATIFVQERILSARSLEGYAYIGIDGLPAEGITVTVCSPDWIEPMETVRTGPSGYFRFETGHKDGLYYLKLSAPGVNTYQLRVRLNHRKKSLIKIALSNAT